MKRRLLQTLITVVVMSSLIAAPVMASPQEDVQVLEEQKKQAQAAASSVNSELVALLVDYNALQKDIENFGVRIAQAESDYQDAKADEEEQYEAMKLRIKYMYEQGNTTFFETIATSKSYSDLVNKAEYVQNVHDYDRDMLDEYVKTKEEVAELKLNLETEQADMEFAAEEMGRQKTALESTLTEMRSQVADFDSQLAAAKEEAAEELEKMTKEVQSAEDVDTGNSGNSGGGNSNNANSGGGNASKPSEGNTGGGNSGGGESAGGGNASKPSDGNSGGNSDSGSAPSKPSNASLGQQIANKGCEYIGNPYVMGGNSLTNGIDCSGFVKQIHAKFGISTPRQSGAIRSGGKAVSYADKLPGDVICYSGHVAIYIGNNTVVHASNSAPYPKGGIKKTSPANYREVLAVRRYW